MLGFLLLPWTTLAYVVFYDVGAGREVRGFEWFLVALAFLFDVGSYAGGRSARGVGALRPPASRRRRAAPGPARGSANSGGAMRR